MTDLALVPAPKALAPLRPGSLTDYQALGRALAASGFFPDAKTEAQAAVKVMAGAELGLPAIASMMGVYIIKSRVAFSATMMAALIQRSGRYRFKVDTMTPVECAITFLERVGDAWEPLGTSTFTMKDAITAQLTGNATWRQYPRNMLYARALSNGARWFCASVFGGQPVYTPDELGATLSADAETVERLPGVEDALPPSVESIPFATAKLDALFGERWHTVGALTAALWDGIVLLDVASMEDFARQYPAQWLAGCELLAAQEA